VGISGCGAFNSTSSSNSTPSSAVFSTLDATNWRAEHARRPAVVTRKMCGGGSRTQRGAESQQVLASVLRTADQRGLDATDVLVTLLTAPTPVVPPRLRAIPAVPDPLNKTSQLPTPNGAQSGTLGVVTFGVFLGVGSWELGIT
jgi:hypothetical protein